ncbi:hypothetical protein ACHAW5_005494 [Stephanodiscus triporus]|uniref:Uncharacterized protein n=1 Tax=Stephanodiscus triporus TaxID=2934178 RepID=A0ABD3MHZ9_9STRA
MTMFIFSAVNKDGHSKALLSLTTWMAIMRLSKATQTAVASWQFLPREFNMSRGPSPVRNTHAALNIRGGDGIWGKPMKAKGRDVRQSEDVDLLSAAAESDVDEQEYEYEYEYYEEDDAVEGGDDVDVEYENYPEERNDDDAYYDQFEDGDLIKDVEKKKNRSIDNDVSIGGNGKSFWGWGKKHKNSDASSDERSAAQVSKVTKSRGLIQVEDGVNDEEEERDDLFTTPISAANQHDVRSPSKFQMANFFFSNRDPDIAGDELDDAKEDYSKANEYEENGDVEEVDDYDDYSSHHLYETPIHNTKVAKSQPLTRNATKSSRAKISRWRLQPSQIAEKGPSKQKQWRNKSSSNASFISHPFFSRESHRSFAVRFNNRRSSSSNWLSSLSATLTVIIQPIGNIIQTISCNMASIMSRWISTSWLLVCNTLDFLWYGPVEGVTTTGISTREGGLSCLLISAPVIAMSSAVILGVVSVLISRRWSESSSGDKSMKDREVQSDENEDELDPSVEEELKFLRRDFDAANLFSKERIAKSITKRNRLLSNLRRRDDRPKSRRGQRQFTIKSIQTWWKERPSQQSIAIIEPQHLRNQQQPLGQEIIRLQKQLAVSEQERAILRQDVHHLKDKLQRVQHEARKIISQNQRLEKESSVADRILPRAVKVERQKSDDELGMVRESMKGVSERERMLMRGRNDLDIRQARNTRILDGVKIVREVDLDREDDDDRNWTAL